MLSRMNPSHWMKCNVLVVVAEEEAAAADHEMDWTGKCIDRNRSCDVVLSLNRSTRVYASK
jgi:hypothetical protein